MAPITEILTALTQISARIDTAFSPDADKYDTDKQACLEQVGAQIDALIEQIRADHPDSHDRTLVVADPHERTLVAAAGIDEAARLLAHATMTPAGLAYPCTVYCVLGDLAAAVARLPQTLEQMSAFIADQAAAGRIRENPAYGDHGGDAGTAAICLSSVTFSASRLAVELAKRIDKAQATVRGLESTRDHDQEG